MAPRITYRRRCSYNTRANVIKAVRTPGNKVVAHYVAKKANGPKCADTGVALPGIPCLRPFEYKNIAKRHRTVSRAYGGVLCSKAVKTRIIGAFLAEEKRLLKVIQKKRAADEKAAKAKEKAAKATKKPVAKKADKKTAKK